MRDPSLASIYNSRPGRLVDQIGVIISHLDRTGSRGSGPRRPPVVAYTVGGGGGQRVGLLIHSSSGPANWGSFLPGYGSAVMYMWRKKGTSQAHHFQLCVGGGGGWGRGGRVVLCGGGVPTQVMVLRTWLTHFRSTEVHPLRNQVHMVVRGNTGGDLF